MKSHNFSSQSPWFSPWDWPADMSTVKEMFWAMDKPGIHMMSKKITKGVSKSSILCSPRRDLGFLACLCSWLNQYGQHFLIPVLILGKWGIHLFCQCWSVLIFSHPGGQENTRRHRWRFSFQIHSFRDSALIQEGNLLFSVKSTK